MVNTLLAERCHAAGLPFQIRACPPPALRNPFTASIRHHLEPDAFQVILPDWFVVRATRSPFSSSASFGSRSFRHRALQSTRMPNAVCHRPSSAFWPTFQNFSASSAGQRTTEWYASMRSECGDLSISSPGTSSSPACITAPRGSYSNVACIEPTCAVAWNKLALSDPEGAMEIQRILAFLDNRIVRTSRPDISTPPLTNFLPTSATER